ncbi:MAG TPA: NAD(P)/FAD-dependent oxidoreductase [Thermoplasmata archaeon]|nr:NAD(P)/FAD-dependent oxidoreductase [Thermoplasmata archaeon]
MERYDVVVVGAGPAGSSAARFAAEGGARTLLVDQRPTLGVPVQCGEFLPTAAELGDLLPCGDVLAEAYDVPRETILRTTREMVCVGPDRHRFRFPLEGFSVARDRFDQALAERARQAGAELRHPLGVTRVDRDGVRFTTGEPVKARVVVGADGPISTVARGMGFQAPRTLYRMITASAKGKFPAEIDLYFGSVAPRGYAWMIPKTDGANVGLGVTEIPRGQSLSSLLDRFASEAQLGPVADRTRWWVPIGPPPSSAVRGNALFCGDAANLVMATNGGGIPTAMISGRDAGVAAAAHIRDGTSLREYDRLWKAHLHGPLDRGYRIKRFGDRVVRHDFLLSIGMRYIGRSGLDAMMRLRWPARLGRVS